MLNPHRLRLHGRPVALPGRHASLNQAWLGIRSPQWGSSIRYRPGIRNVASEAGENDTGHINPAENENILFFDNVFPLRLQWLSRLPFQAEAAIPRLLKHLNTTSIPNVDPLKAIEQSNVDKTPLKVMEVLPRLKEGGAFVKFQHDPSVSAETIAENLKEYLKGHPMKPWWNPFQSMRTNLVRGRPWVEDLYRLPSSRLKVEFLPPKPGQEAAELSQEQLYSYFRPYGKLSDIIPQPPDSKVLPKYALLDFAQVKPSVMAKNCMHGYIVPESAGGGKSGTVLRLTYEQKRKAHWLRDWLTSHPRIVIPILGALAAAFTVAVFDPIRTFFVKAHITRAFHIADNRVYRWFRAQATDWLSFHRRKEDEEGMQAVWDDRKENIQQLQTWLMETADTFIIVQGPRGSGKKELVLNQALKDKKNKLVIDCKPIQEARGDGPTIAATAKQVGYRPVFSWMNSFSGMIDMAAAGATGVKTGFSETLDSQLQKILNNTGTALKEIALDCRKKGDKDSQLGDDEYLEAHPEKRPVIVIDNFLHKAQENSLVYDKIADWAAALTTSNIAHVIFLTTDVSFTKSLSKALPDRVFRQISLSDCSPEVAKRFVITHLDADVEDDGEHADHEKKLTHPVRKKDLQELDTCISYLGGRLTDLEFLARRIKTGETPTKAVNEIIEQSASEILKMYLFVGDDNGRKWTPEQAWLLVKQLAEKETLRYNEVLLSDTYKSGGDDVLHALEQAELISIVAANGRPQAIKPGRPVYQPAFKLLTEDRVLRSRLDLAILTEQTKIENATIDKCENELRLLAELPKQPAEVTSRVKYLLDKLAASQAKVEAYDAESGKLKKVLKEEY
ncbi:hypothetical protein M501DRAFT_1002758 [Patellaria atrata CBS 101060]|uniref:Mitochondrial escape protein 2 n=1 Tax=Patellaria atrata CBS 101060 TaxID=1346257 RepID=A0A9P4SCX5_9PEZI|nr:hypothetical protein M501DRAFT_1002758 [Patellaria atrata CBS 101060]